MPSPSRLLARGVQALLVCAVAGAAMGLLSCTPEQKHRTLTFFFDGVPPLHPVEEPAEKGVVPKPGQKTVERPRVQRPVWSEHEPMKDKTSCVKCHSATRSFSPSFLGSTSTSLSEGSHFLWRKYDAGSSRILIWGKRRPRGRPSQRSRKWNHALHLF